MGDNKKKHLVLVVEHTSALAPYWTRIVENYLRKLIMAFCGNQNTNAAGPNVALGLVEFSEINSGWVQWSGWTEDVDYFFTWLLAIQFKGGGFCDVEIAQGLSSALKHLPSPSQTQKNVGIQKHCILVAASNPPNNSVTESKICLSDAEKVALSFPESFVSLSIICPKQLPKLRSIYNAGKRNPLASDYTIDIVESPHDLVLISDSFIEACSDVSQSGITILPSNPCPNDGSQNLRLAAIPEGASTEVGGNSMTGSKKLPGLDQVAHHTTHGLLTAVTPNISDKSSLDMSGIQGYADKAHSVPLVTQVNLQSPQLVKNGTRRPSSRNIAQQVQTASALKAFHSPYVKLWEGDLLGRKNGKPVIITRIQGFRGSGASELLAKDWPSTMLIEESLSQDRVICKESMRMQDILVFQANSEHGVFRKLKELNRCGVVWLPSQTLLLAVSDIQSQLFGLLFPKASLVLESKKSE